MALATGLAMGGMRPVVALYSTFLQRAFDQTVHDVCQNDQPVLIAVDRAGLVGEDGTSHQGMFTLPAQRQLPNLVIACPKDEQELRSLLRTALAQDHPFALHYPRDAGFGLPPVEPVAILPIGRGEVAARGDATCCSSAFGPIVARAVEAADALAAEGWSVAVINARFAKPLDRELILAEARGKRLVVTFEESVVSGGFGSGVLEAIEEARLGDAALRDVPVRIVGIPGERFVDHGSVADLRQRPPARRAGPRGPGPRDARSSSGRPRRCAHRRPRSRSPPDPATPRQPRTRRVCGSGQQQRASASTPTTPNSSDTIRSDERDGPDQHPEAQRVDGGSERPADPEASPGADPAQRRGQPVERDHDHDHVAEGHVRCRCHGRECHDQRQADDEPAQADDHVQDRRERPA